MTPPMRVRAGLSYGERAKGLWVNRLSNRVSSCQPVDRFAISDSPWLSDRNESFLDSSFSMARHSVHIRIVMLRVGLRRGKYWRNGLMPCKWNFVLISKAYVTSDRIVGTTRNIIIWVKIYLFWSGLWLISSIMAADTCHELFPVCPREGSTPERIPNYVCGSVCLAFCFTVISIYVDGFEWSVYIKTTETMQAIFDQWVFLYGNYIEDWMKRNYMKKELYGFCVNAYLNQINIIKYSQHN